MKTKDRTKDQEVAAITHLAIISDYFADFIHKFLGSDMVTIADNIKNGHPLEFGSRLGDRLAQAEDAAKRIRDERARLLAYLIGHVDEDGEQFIGNVIGRTQVICCKRKKEIRLSESDIDYLINIANGKVVEIGHVLREPQEPQEPQNSTQSLHPLLINICDELISRITNDLRLGVIRDETERITKIAEKAKELKHAILAGHIKLIRNT